ncbi:MAG: Fic family protein [Kiritimatiellia bacterium]
MRFLIAGNPAKRQRSGKVGRILELLAEGGPMRPSALRKAVGIRSSIHFNRYYLSPLLEKGAIARTDSEHPQSPQQRYCLT